jgi:hypothetical protein
MWWKYLPCSIILMGGMITKAVKYFHIMTTQINNFLLTQHLPKDRHGPWLLRPWPMDLTAPLPRGMSALRTAAVADDVYMMIVYFADDVRRTTALVLSKSGGVEKSSFEMKILSVDGCLQMKTAHQGFQGGASFRPPPRLSTTRTVCSNTHSAMRAFTIGT